MQQSWYIVSDECNFGSVCHFLAVHFRDKDAPTNVALKRWYQTKTAEQINPLFCVNISSEAWLEKKYFSHEELAKKINTIMDQKHAPKMHQFFLLTASLLQGHRSCPSYQRRLKDEGRVSVWTRSQSNRVASNHRRGWESSSHETATASQKTS